MASADETTQLYGAPFGTTAGSPASAGKGLAQDAGMSKSSDKFMALAGDQGGDKVQSDGRSRSNEKAQNISSTARPSRVIQESRETQDEGIVIRWQRERKDELMFELRPERS
jgi:hypothetical protein